MERTLRGAALSEEISAPEGLEQGIWDALESQSESHESSERRTWLWGVGAAVCAGLVWLAVNPSAQGPSNHPATSLEGLSVETELASPEVGTSFEGSPQMSVADGGVSEEMKEGLVEIESGETEDSPGSSKASVVTDQGSSDVVKPQPMRAMGERDAKGLDLQHPGSQGLKTDPGLPQTERRPASIEVKE
ncbi:MAG: hypothetical protein O3B70_02205 [Bacteroidetes bacterium]|nr:hypothetical protein [Bacteroidota bacterium]MDA0903123.1 hypothetical protein [Bacteroidota bacterium]MDA1242370.1 hypothetical protein [Bacteroidota bacterium]